EEDAEPGPERRGIGQHARGSRAVGAVNPRGRGGRAGPTSPRVDGQAPLPPPLPCFLILKWQAPELPPLSSTTSKSPLVSLPGLGMVNSASHSPELGSSYQVG